MKTLIILLIASAAFGASPAEVAIKKAQAEVAQHPDHAQFYNMLALAYSRRARETSDAQFYAKAEEALQKSFAIAPDNYEGLKTQAWLQLGRHDFAKALETAKKLNQKTPDDVMVYGYLADANTELGNYKDAVAAVQWMLDLRAGNIPALTRAAGQRELHGNLSGSLELMQMAYDAMSSVETEERAWLLARMAHVSFVGGDLSKADTYANRALSLFGDYHSALGTLAEVRIAQKRYDEAVALLRKRYAEAPHAENLYALADALELAGQTDEARTDFAEFERQSLAETNLTDNSNGELIAYYVDHAHDSVKALEVATREIARRQDVFTLDGYAWALAASGDYAGANVQIQKALQIGVKDPKILAHAEYIVQHAHRDSVNTIK